MSSRFFLYVLFYVRLNLQVKGRLTTPPVVAHTLNLRCSQCFVEFTFSFHFHKQLKGHLTQTSFFFLFSLLPPHRKCFKLSYGGTREEPHSRSGGFLTLAVNGWLVGHCDSGHFDSGSCKFPHLAPQPVMPVITWAGAGRPDLPETRTLRK